MTESIDPQVLLRETAWLRKLARSLAANSYEADDLFQDAWVAALEHPPRTYAGNSARGWLAAVVHNLARLRGRGLANARARERAAARGEALPSVHDSVERVAAQRELVDAVLTLEPAERDLVVLRYFEELPPREICQRLGLSGPTVRSRLSRALARLRDQLDRRNGREAWVALLVPGGLTADRAPAPAATPNVPLVLAVVGAAAVSIAVALALHAPEGEPARASTEVEAAAAETVPGTEGKPAAGAEVRAPASAPEHVSLASGAPAPSMADTVATWTLTVRFVDLAGAGIAGVELAHSDRGDEWSTRSDASGAVRIQFPWPYPGRTVGAGQIELTAKGPALTTLRWYQKIEGPGEQDLGALSLAPGGTLIGRVVDESGQPLAGAVLMPSSGYTPDSAAGLDEARTLETNLLWPKTVPNGLARTASGTDGRFVLEGVPATLVAAHANARGRLGAFSAPVPLAPGQVVDVGQLLLALPGPENLVAGTVLDAQDRPLARIQIQCAEGDPRRSRVSPLEALSDADGRFEFLVPRSRTWGLLFSRDERKRDPLVLAAVPSGTLDLDVRLPDERWIAVRASDAAGAPVPLRGVNVWDAHGFYLNPTSEPQPDGSLRMRLPAVPFKVYAIAPGWQSEPTGMLDPAVVGAELVFTSGQLAGVSGRVLVDGQPVAGARVHVHAPAEGGGGVSDDGFSTRLDDPSDSVETDAQGAFRIPMSLSRALTLHADLAGSARAELGTLDFVAGTEHDGVELVFAPGGTLEGRLLTAEGVDAAGKVVGVSAGDGHVLAQRLGADGTYRFEHLRPGPYQVRTCAAESLDPRHAERFLPGSAATVTWDATVRAGEVTRFDLDHRDRIPARLRGELRLDGSVTPGWSCQLYSDEDGDSETLDGSGGFELRVPRPGAYGLNLHGSTGTAIVCLHQTIELGPGDNPWARDLPTGAVTLTNVPAFARPNRHLQEAPPYCLVWRGDPVLTWYAMLYEPPATAGGELNLPKVPAGLVQVVQRPPDVDRLYAFPDASWPVVLEFALATGGHTSVRLP